MSRPATITSPTHGVGVLMVIAQGALAVQLITGVARTDALDHLLPDPIAALVPAIMLGSAIASLAGITAVTRAETAGQTLPWLVVEACAKALLAGTSLAYAWSLTDTYGWSGGATTQTYAWALGVGLCVRVLQIVRDRRRLRMATAHPQPATPAPLAEPDRDS